MPRATESLSDRLMRHVEPDLNGGCWLWSGAMSHRGYGVIKDTGTRRPIKAHRASWRSFRGEIPDGQFVCHRCDTPACINPAHLFLGTHADNMADMMRKGRTAVPPINRITNLSEADVHHIRANTMSTRGYSLLYGVAEPTVRDIKSRRTWRHI